jgi:hypothetical protein
MPILKKKKKRKKRRKENQRRNSKKSSNLKGKVYMPQKKAQATSRKKKVFSLFKNSSRSKSNVKKRKLTKRKKVLYNISRAFLYIILPLLFLGLLYISTLSILNMRNRGGDENAEMTYIVGIEEVPAYPGSQFIFQNNIDEVSVANFLGSGNSAYRLPLNKSVTQAYEYYQQKLPELGWQHVLSVEVGSQEMKEGEYWVKDGAGLRIYSKFNDIWYEVVNVEEANNGLRARVEKEIERDLLLAGQEIQELLPDFPWVIEIPKEYVISYRTSNYEDLRIVEFRKIGSSERVTVTPVSPIGGPLDNHLREYLEILKSRKCRRCRRTK